MIWFMPPPLHPIIKGENLVIKYDTALCVRINDHLKSTITEICTDTRINEADWVRSRLADCAKKDVADLDQVKQDFLFG